MSKQRTYQGIALGIAMGKQLDLFGNDAEVIFKKTNLSECEVAALAAAAEEVEASGFTYEPAYSFIYMGKAYAFSYESIKSCAGEPAYTAAVPVWKWY